MGIEITYAKHPVQGLGHNQRSKNVSDPLHDHLISSAGLIQITFPWQVVTLPLGRGTQ